MSASDDVREVRALLRRLSDDEIRLTAHDGPRATVRLEAHHRDGRSLEPLFIHKPLTPVAVENYALQAKASLRKDA